jgi:hypothetical protein
MGDLIVSAGSNAVTKTGFRHLVFSTPGFIGAGLRAGVIGACSTHYNQFREVSQRPP